MKNWFLLVLMAFGVVSCSTTKKSTASNAASAKGSSSPEFINNISVTPGATKSSSSISKETAKKNAEDASAGNAFGNVNIEKVDKLMFKYAIMLDAPVESIGGQKSLFTFIDDWYGTPYKYGGHDKKGIDCSAFSSTLMATIFGLTVPRTSKDQYTACEKVSKTDLQEGDLVFFNIRGRGISHVGVYLTNNKFVHASTSSGVMISDLGEGYYASKFAGGGRPKK